MPEHKTKEQMLAALEKEVRSTTFWTKAGPVLDLVEDEKRCRELLHDIMDWYADKSPHFQKMCDVSLFKRIAEETGREDELEHL